MAKYSHYSDVIFCPRCGTMMHQETLRDGLSYYTCDCTQLFAHKQRASCSIQVDTLEAGLLELVKIVLMKLSTMVGQMEARKQPIRLKECEDDIAALVEQHAYCQDQLKALLKRKNVDSIYRPDEQVSIYRRQYAQIEEELAEETASLEKKIEAAIEGRNRLIALNRTVRTANELIHDIHDKPEISMDDICRIVDEIQVYPNNTIEVAVRRDIAAFIELGTLHLGPVTIHCI